VSIDRKTVLGVMKLARLDLEPGEIDAMGAQLDRIVGYVNTLSEVNTENVEPTAHAAVETAPLRVDAATPSLDRELASREAPHWVHDGFGVPLVIDN
jgi:aspartyl-tRNA(Asn)/glutamyl-tRNA(Gln) amidotransferase subunit C